MDINLSLTQLAIQKRFADARLNLTWHQEIPDNKTDVFWYGGTIAEITDNHGGHITAIANGDVIGRLLKDNEEIDSFKDTGNNGYRHDIETWIHNDEELTAAKNAEGHYTLDLLDNNWLEWFYDKEDEDGNIIKDVFESTVDDNDDIYVALDNPGWCTDIFEQIKQL